ncbi:MAG: hypothetical protein WAM59_06375 [Candidatus Acidiferrales bacterium]
MTEKELFQKRKFRVALVVAIIVVLLLFLRVYDVRIDAGGTLFWNADEAYFFIGMVDRGYDFSYLGDVIEQVREIYPLGASPSNYTHCSLLVLHITSNSIQQYSIDDFLLAEGPEPFEGTLYLTNDLPGGGAIKWLGNSFKPTTPEEDKRVHEYAISLPQGPPMGPSYDNVQGWSKRTVVGQIIRKSSKVFVEEDSKVTVEIAGKPLTFVMNSGFISHDAYIDLIRPGQPPERIWHLDERPHRVSRGQYYRIFRDEIAQQVVRQIRSQP